MRITVLTGLLYLLLAPVPGLAQEMNAGIVQGLWYSDKPVFVTDTVRVYVAVRNNTGGDITGSITFYDNGDRFSSMQISALDGRIIEAWADWTPTYGEHTITADLSRVKRSLSGTEEWVEVISALSEDTLFVDFDTDGDDIGNTEDTDDDNDGISDEEEEKKGTDPLDPNDPSSIQETTEEETTDEPATPSEPEESNTNAAPAGLEEYLAPSRARTALEQITDLVQNTQARVDEYRANRSGMSAQNYDGEVEEATASSTSPSTTQPADSLTVGTITRSGGTESTGFVSKIFNWVTWVANAIYTFILFTLSLYLAHPIIVQITLLLILLYLFYRLAKKLGSRPTS